MSSFQSSWFYFETPNRNSRVVELYLTWQMAGERRSFRLSLSVRWSIPVPIVSLVFSPWSQRQNKLNCRHLHVTSLDSARSEMWHFYPQSKGGHTPFSHRSFWNKRRVDVSRRRRWIDVRAHEPAALVGSRWGGLVHFQRLLIFNALAVTVRGLKKKKANPNWTRTKTGLEPCLGAFFVILGEWCLKDIIA